jgi:hypothetical protein
VGGPNVELQSCDPVLWLRYPPERLLRLTCWSGYIVVVWRRFRIDEFIALVSDASGASKGEGTSLVGLSISTVARPRGRV